MHGVLGFHSAFGERWLALFIGATHVIGDLQQAR